METWKEGKANSIVRKHRRFWERTHKWCIKILTDMTLLWLRRIPSIYGIIGTLKGIAQLHHSFKKPWRCISHTACCTNTSGLLFVDWLVGLFTDNEVIHERAASSFSVAHLVYTCGDTTRKLRWTKTAVSWLLHCFAMLSNETRAQQHVLVSMFKHNSKHPTRVCINHIWMTPHQLPWYSSLSLPVQLGVFF